MNQIPHRRYLRRKILQPPTPAPAAPQPVELKFVYSNFPFPPTPSSGLEWESWAHSIEDASNGLVKIEIFSSGEMGTHLEHCDIVASGKADIAFFWTEYTPELFPLSGCINLPLIFTSPQVSAGALWQFHKKYTAETEMKDIKLLALYTGSPSQLFTNRVHVKTLEDFEGLKMAVFSPLQAKIMESLGAIPVSTPTEEMFTYQEQGLIEGISIPWKMAVAFKATEAFKYRTANTDLKINTALIGINRDSWNKLHPDIQNVITGATGLLWSRHLGMVKELDVNENLLTVQEYDKEVGNPDIYWLPDDERKRWQEAVKPVWDGWAQEMEDMGLPGRAALDDLLVWVEQYQEMWEPKENPPPTPEAPTDLSDIPEYTWEEAIDHVGEYATVTGPIIDSLDLRDMGFGDHIVIGMGKSVSDRETVGIGLVVDDAFLPEDLYIGKTISVTGVIYLNPFGSAVIDITDLAMIQVIE